MKKNLLQRVTTVLVSATIIACIAACGGGGGTASPTPPPPAPVPPPTPSIAGFWGETITNSTAIVLANGDAWVVPGDLASFSRIQLTTSGTSFSGTGTTYTLGGSTAATNPSGTFVEKTSITGLVSNPLSYNSAYETAAPLSDAVGSWQGSYNNGAKTVTLTVAATTGAISGTSSTGCSYAGTLQPRTADPSVYDVAYAETCGVSPSQTTVSLSGIGRVNTAKTALMIAVTTADKAQGALFAGAKQ